MKTILIPIDFSENSSTAFRYGLMFASKTKQNIILFHAAHLPHGVVPPVVAASFEEFENKKLQELEQWRAIHRNGESNVTVDCFVKQGFAADEIISLVMEKNIDMIIMGTKGETGLLDKMIGSITSNVIEKAQCPVLAIPGNVSLSNIKRIVFATDYRDNDFETLTSIAEIARNVNAEIVVLHISLEDKEYEKEIENLDSFAGKVKNTISYDRIVCRLLKGKSVEEGLNHFMKEIQTDILAVSKGKGNFISKLVNHSVTNKLAQHPEVPLFAFHVIENGLKDKA